MAGKIVKCVYNFEAETESDLTLIVGDLIKVTNVISDEWYEGELNGKMGQFPKAFVEVPKDVFDVGIALSAFKGEQDGDLTLQEGDFVVITEVIDDNWSKGYTHGGSSGVFPRNFVKQVSFEDSAMREALQAVVPRLNSELDNNDVTDYGNLYTTISPFNAQGDNELELIVGIKVEVLREFDDFWLEGKLHNGKQGIFPRTCIDYPENTENIEASTDKHSNVDLILSEPVVTPAVDSSSEYVVAIFDYQSDVNGDLSFIQSDKILLLERIDDNWFKGELNGLSGVFPSNHVKFSEHPIPVSDSSGNLLEQSKQLNDEVQQVQTDITAVKLADVNVEAKPPKPVVVDNIAESKPTNKASPGHPRKGPPGRPTMGPKKKVSSEQNSETQQGLIPPEVNSTQTSPSTSPKTAKKKPPPGRPKMPAIKKDALPPFSYKFTTESQPTVIIAGWYVKSGEPHVIILRKSQQEVSAS